MSCLQNPELQLNLWFDKQTISWFPTPRKLWTIFAAELGQDRAINSSVSVSGKTAGAQGMAFSTAWTVNYIPVKFKMFCRYIRHMLQAPTPDVYYLSITEHAESGHLHIPRNGIHQRGIK